MDIAMNIGVSAPPEMLGRGWLQGRDLDEGQCKLLPIQAPAAAAEDLAFFLSLPMRHSYGDTAPTASFAPWSDADRDRAWLASILARPGGHAGLPAPLADF